MSVCRSVTVRSSRFGLQLATAGTSVRAVAYREGRDDAERGEASWCCRWCARWAPARCRAVPSSPHGDDVVTVRSALTGDFQESGGQVVMEAEHFTGNVAQGGHSWAAENDANAAGGQAMRSTPDNAANVDTGYVTGSPRLDFRVLFATTGTYQVWVRGRAGGSVAGDSDSVHGGLDGAAIASADRINGFTASFGWTRGTLDGVERDAVGDVDRRPHHQPVDARGRLRRRQGAADDERVVHADRHGTGREPARGYGHGQRRRRRDGWQRGRGGAGGTGGGTSAIPDPSLPVATRVADLLGRMTLDEKLGQMTQSEQQTSSPAQVTSLFIGSVLSGADSSLPSPTAAAWADLIDSYQTGALATRLHIPMIYGIDAVHGHAKVIGATVFPHNIGLGATRNPALVQQTGAVTAQELTATGVQWTFAPALSVARDQRWGRAYESFGEDPALVTSMTTAISGLQGGGLNLPDTVLATAKHFVGDGGAVFGTGNNPGGTPIDRGDDQMTDAALRAIHLAPYPSAITRGVGSVMASFSSVNGLKMHANAQYLTTVLKGELAFSGFVISDWQAIDQLTGTFADKVRVSVNAGVDMFMMPDSYCVVHHDPARRGERRPRHAGAHRRRRPAHLDEEVRARAVRGADGEPQRRLADRVHSAPQRRPPGGARVAGAAEEHRQLLAAVADDDGVRDRQRRQQPARADGRLDARLAAAAGHAGRHDDPAGRDVGGGRGARRGERLPGRDPRRVRDAAVLRRVVRRRRPIRTTTVAAPAPPPTAASSCCWAGGRWTSRGWSPTRTRRRS